MVSLYSGSLFHRYRFKEWDDVRLVFTHHHVLLDGWSLWLLLRDLLALYAGAVTSDPAAAA